MKHSLITNDPNKMKAWVSFDKIPTPPGFDQLSQQQKEAYIITYVSDLQIHDLILLITNPKRRKFVYLASDPQNADKSYKDLWLMAGYKNLNQYYAAETCIITQVAIKRLKQNKIQENIRSGSKILEPDDLLHILSGIIINANATLGNGKKFPMKNPNIYIKSIELLMKAHNMLNNTLKIDGDIKLEIKLPENDIIDVTPIPLINIHSENEDINNDN